MAEQNRPSSSHVEDGSSDAAEKEAIESFTDRYNALKNDKGLTSKQRHAAARAMSTEEWIATCHPPLFAAALSLDAPEIKAANMEATLRAGADPNELDHDLLNNHGRPLACCVDENLHWEVNGSLDGLANNLQAIEVLLRDGADPRLRGHGASAHDALLLATFHADQWDSKPTDKVGTFYKAARKIIEDAAAALVERDNQDKEGLGT